MTRISLKHYHLNWAEVRYVCKDLVDIVKKL